MFKGFYNLTSAMLSHGRRLDVVSHNMTNISTAGYKAQRYTDSTFQEVMISRVGNKDKSRSTELGISASRARAFSPSTGMARSATPAPAASPWTMRAT